MRTLVAAVALVFVGALPFSAARAEQAARLEIPDGRVIRGTKLRKEKDAVVLETVFGPLRVPNALLQPPKPDPQAAPTNPNDNALPDAPRVTTSRWIKLESDLSLARTRTYHDMLDAFVERMIEIYELDKRRVAKRAPFHVLVWRSKDDFKAVQDRIAPGIAALKGKEFAEATAGFYSPGEDKVYMWDARGMWGDHPTVALHEVCHLVNTRLSAATGVRFSQWFEEGSAMYFQMFVPGTSEPDLNLSALATVTEAIEAGTPMGNRELRSVSYADFKGYEYAWGWALVQFLRRHEGGKHWKPLLKFQRTASAGAPGDSENGRFLKAIKYENDAKLNEAWHAYLLTLVPEENVPLGASQENLVEVEAIEKPTPEQAQLFAGLGRSFARAGNPKPAVVYLRAARRGGVEDTSLCLLFARMLAEDEGLAVDEPWPAEAFSAIEHAVRIGPLRADARLVLGRQLLLRATDPDEAQEPLDQLGLALLVMGPDDDDKMIAKWALTAGCEAMPQKSPQEVRAWLAERVPPAEASLRAAWVYFLQEREAWELLIEALEGRLKGGTASFSDRKTLAGLYLASDRNDEAATIYAALLAEDAGAVTLWPHYVRALAASGKPDEAADAKAKGLEAADRVGSFRLRRIIERIPVR